jgi:transcriptional regulator with XRE-family HTH domain
MGEQFHSAALDLAPASHGRRPAAPAKDLEPPFARRLKQARLRRGLSQTGLGVAAGIDIFSASPRLNQYEKGKRSPDFRTAERLAHVLGCPVSFFFIRDDDLAEMMLAIHELSAQRRRQLLAQLLQHQDPPIAPAAARGSTISS